MSGTGKWAPKLTYEERCGFYYASTLGVPRNVIVLASGLNRGTVMRLTNRKYRAYAGIHQKFDELGKDAFRDLYYTKEVQARLAAAQVPGPPVGSVYDTCTPPGYVPLPAPAAHSPAVRVQAAGHTPAEQHAQMIGYLQKRAVITAGEINKAAERYAELNGTTIEYAMTKVLTEMIEHYK